MVFLRKDFWTTGVVLIITVVAMILWQLKSVADETHAVETSVFAVVRTEQRTIRWALDEWMRCNKGQGTYASQRVVTKDQCDVLVGDIAEQRGQRKEVESALKLLRHKIEVATKNIEIPWPTSALAPLLFHGMFSLYT